MSSASRPSRPVRNLGFPAVAIGLRRFMKAIPSKPKPENGNHSNLLNITYPVGGVTAAVEMVRVEVAAFDPGVIAPGAKVQVTPAGGLVQDSEIWLSNPLVGVAPTEIMADCPGVTVALCAESESEKLAFVAAVAGSRVANRPLVWVGPPAVK